MAKSTTTKAAWIGASAVVLAAFIGLWKYSGSATNIKTGDQFQSQVLAGSQVNSIVNNYNNYPSPDSETRQAVAALDQKLKETSSRIEFTSNEVQLLSRALKDLDERTSGIRKLPDGRTQFGHIVSGKPTVIFNETQAAAQKYNVDKDYVSAFEHSQRAIKAYETSPDGILPEGTITKQAVGELYYGGALSAFRLLKDELALKWSGQALDANYKPDYVVLQTLILTRLERRSEAAKVVNRALEKWSENSTLTLAKKYLDETLTSQVK